MCSITVREIVTMFLKKLPLDTVASWVKEKFNYPEDEENDKILKKSLNLLKAKFDTRYVKSHRMKQDFLRNNAKWLESTFEVKKHVSKKNVGGRPRKSFGELKQRCRLLKSQRIREQYSTEELISSTASALRTDGKRSLAWIIEHLYQHPEKATRIKSILQSGAERETNLLSVDEGLRFLCENDLTKQQYQNIRNITVDKGHNIFPSYNAIRENKDTCYPQGKFNKPK